MPKRWGVCLHDAWSRHVDSIVLTKYTPFQVVLHFANRQNEKCSFVCTCCSHMVCRESRGNDIYWHVTNIESLGKKEDTVIFYMLLWKWVVLILNTCLCTEPTCCFTKAAMEDVYNKYLPTFSCSPTIIGVQTFYVHTWIKLKRNSH